jgi:hypothetical protein
MRAHQARRHALIVGCLLSTPLALADDPAPRAGAARKSPVEATIQAAPKPEIPPPSTPVAPATRADATRERLATEARISALSSPEEKDRPASKPLRELLMLRKGLLEAWEKANADRLEAENPKRSPESEAAEFKADLEKTRALLEQSSKAPDDLLPEVFQVKDTDARPSEGRLAEMKEAIDEARNELKDQAAQLEALRADGARGLAAQVTTLRLERDKVFQGVAGLNARRAQLQAGMASATSAEARDLARERLANFDWEARVEAERLAGIEARIAQASKRLDLGTFPIQARSARVQLAKRLAERMEARYDALAERQRSDLQRAVVKEETRAANSGDPLERRKAQRLAELFELESQVVAFEKAYATTGGVSLQEQTALADATKTNFAELKRLLDDGSVSPLDALRLKNDFRRIVPERAQVVRTDLAASDAELTTYENALTEAEIDLVNDSRDDRFDRESLLEQLPAGRRNEAKAMLEDLETRHKALLNRRRNVLQKLARRAEDAHNQVVRRIQTLDEQYAFIRTHIFWIRDAEPVGAATIARARDESIRAARAAVHLALEAGDRKLWGRLAPDFILALTALLVLPLPLLLGQRALDRLRIGTVPPTALGRADYEVQGSEG